MMAGYRFVDNLLAQRVDLLAMSNLKLFLELNALVLCGHDQGARAPRPTSPLPNGGFMIRRAAAYAMSSSGTRFSVAAGCRGVYLHSQRTSVVYRGRHRTGALVLSYILAREGRPPFVLTAENAKANLDPSTLITETRKHTVSSRFSGFRRSSGTLRNS
jgi:hypothetical protein